MTIADRVRRLIAAKGLTLSEAARQADMHKQQLHQIMSGQSPNPGVLAIERIVAALGSTMDEFFADNDTQRKPMEMIRVEERQPISPLPGSASGAP
jgi:transcriptional regulator with XRE-family HTH domain